MSQGQKEQPVQLLAAQLHKWQKLYLQDVEHSRPFYLNGDGQAWSLSSLKYHNAHKSLYHQFP